MRSISTRKGDSRMAGKETSKVTRIHHIGITVNDAQKAVEEWREAFGFEGKVVDIPENNLRIGVVKVAGVTFFLNEHTDPARKAGLTQDLELPVTFSGHRIVNKVGEGISHIAFETTDLDYMMEKAKKAGMRVTLEKPRDALEGICNFIVPEDAHIPIEFMQPVEGRKNPLE
jgi:catechol 2,3-dioxygenase-like lactoylglutathione lyase family enzyme